MNYYYEYELDEDEELDDDCVYELLNYYEEEEDEEEEAYRKMHDFEILQELDLPILRYKRYWGKVSEDTLWQILEFSFLSKEEKDAITNDYANLLSGHNAYPSFSSITQVVISRLILTKRKLFC